MTTNDLRRAQWQVAYARCMTMMDYWTRTGLDYGLVAALCNGLQRDIIDLGPQPTGNRYASN